MRPFAALPYYLLFKIRQAAIDARRKDRTWRYVGWSVIAGLTTSMMFVLAMVFALLLWRVGLWWLGISVLALMVVPVITNALARYVLVPAGLHRLAYYAALYSRPGPDGTAYALCVAAWAARDGEGVAWVEARRDTRVPLGDGEVVATAILAANRGDVATARELLTSIARYATSRTSSPTTSRGSPSARTSVRPPA